MAEKVGRKWCRVCAEPRRVTSPGPNHLLHLILSLLTFGLWIIAWIVVALAADWTCTECGSREVIPESRHFSEEKKMRASVEKQRPTDIPPKPSVFREKEHAAWMAEYGKRDR